MPASINLYVNWYTRSFMKSPTNGATFTPPSFSENDIVPMVIQVLQPDPDSYNSFLTPDISSMSLSLTAEDTGDGTIVVQQASWTKDLTTGRFSAEVNFGTSALNTWMGASTSKTAKLKIKKAEGTSTVVIIEQNITILSDESGAALGDVLTGETALSVERAEQIFLKKYADAGDTLTLRTADGTGARTIGVYKDGSSILGQDDMYSI